MKPLATRIRVDIENKIRSNAWPPGFRIPTEHELMVRYGCARMTVHGAISSLVADGLIERRKKAGSFVASPHVQTAVIEIPDIAAIIVGRGQSYRFDILNRQRRFANGRAAFEIEGAVLVIDGLHVADGRPFCLEHRLISLETAPKVEAVDFEEVSPGSWLLKHIPWSQARHRITACAAGPAGRVLKLPKSAPCLSVERWTWRMKRPVTFARQIFPGDRYDLIAEFSPGFSSGFSQANRAI